MIFAAAVEAADVVKADHEVALALIAQIGGLVTLCVLHHFSERRRKRHAHKTECTLAHQNTELASIKNQLGAVIVPAIGAVDAAAPTPPLPLPLPPPPAAAQPEWRETHNPL